MKIFTSKFNRPIVLTVAFLLAVLFCIGIDRLLYTSDTIYLAVAGPTGGDSVSGTEMVQGAQLYVDRINNEGGVDGKKVELLVYDDRNDADLSPEIAAKIVDSPALAVLGHLYSSTSVEAGKIYQQRGIPAITASATADEVTQGNYWSFRVVFNNSLQANFIANYAEKILKYDRASIIYSDDSYGESLRSSFSKTFNSLGGEIKHQWAIDLNADDFEQKKKQIISDLQASNDNSSEIIFCATHNNDVVELIVQMKRQGLNYPLIGADSLGNVAFAQKFQQYTEAETTPGYFSDGIYAVSPIIFDVANEKAQQFRNEYIRTYEQQPSWTAANYYNAASIAIAAIERANLNINTSSISQQRQQVRDALAKINSVANSVTGLTGDLYFDRLGNFNESIYIGTFSDRKFISAFTQLQSVNNLQQVGNLQQALDSDKILLVDGRYMHKTNIVYTGIDINEIRNLDEKTSSYLMDFYLWFRYKADIDADNIEFTNYGTDRMDSGDKLELDDPIEESKIDGINYRVYRVKADFKEKFRFDDYPFDRQKLAIRFRHANLTRDDLIYVVDEVGMRDTVADEIIVNWEESKVFETISDWKVTEVDFFPDVLVNDSSLGNPRFFGLDNDLEYSRFNTVIYIKRDTVSFAIKHLLPLLFFVGISYLLLFLPFESISVEAVSGTLLAIVFFHISLLESLPEGIGYMVALDYGFYIIYGLIGLELLLVVVGNKPEIQKDKAAVQRLILTGRIVFPVILITSAIALIVRYGILN